MKIVVDSNIVFSSILNTQSKLGQLLINGARFFDFYSIGLLKDEILEHKNKIIKISGFTEIQFQQTYHIIIDKIQFIDDVLLSDEDIFKAEELVKDIDENDLLFVALNNHLHSVLWTGDKKLVNGLRNKRYTRLITTDELYQKYLDKEATERIKI